MDGENKVGSVAVMNISHCNDNSKKEKILATTVSGGYGYDCHMRSRREGQSGGAPAGMRVGCRHSDSVAQANHKS